MNSREIYDALKEIGDISGAAKVEALKKYDDEDFKRALVLAYSPFITFGVKKYSLNDTGTGTYDFSAASVWQLLNELAERELTGQDAQDQIKHHVGMCDSKSRMLFKMIVHKDLRCGMSISTINKAFKDLVPVFNCMLAHKFVAKKVKKWPVAIEPKMDGVRVLAFVDRSKDEVQFFSRTGKEFHTFNHLKAPLLSALQTCWVDSVTDEMTAQHEIDAAQNEWDSIVLDGEIVSGSFNKTVSEVRKKDEQATDAEFFIFDAIDTYAFEDSEKKGNPHFGDYVNRRETAEKIVDAVPDGSGINLLDCYKASTEAEVHYYYQRFRDAGLEGAIVKDLKGLYHFRRNAAWMKIKAEESVDVPIVGAIEGTGKYEGSLGALIVDVDGVKVNVGTGIDDSQRAEFWKAYQDDLSNPSDYEGNLLGRLIEVQYHEVTPDKSLRHPRFVRFRDDKATW